MPPVDGHLLLAVGRLGPEKGFDLLIQAFASLSNRGDWRLVILGEGADRAHLENLASGLPVALPGTQADLSPWYERADLFVLSSRLEGFPNVLLEGLAAGCPAVSFDCPAGPADLIQHGINGELVVAQDVAQLASTLADLMHDPVKRARYASHATESVSRYSVEQIMPLWNQLFDGSMS